VEEDIEDDKDDLHNPKLSPYQKTEAMNDLKADEAKLTQLQDLKNSLELGTLLEQKAQADERKRRAEQAMADINSIRQKHPKNDPLDAAASEGGKAADDAVQAAAKIPQCRAEVAKLRTVQPAPGRDLFGTQRAGKVPSGGGGGTHGAVMGPAS